MLRQAGHIAVWRVDGPMGAGKTTLIQAICRQLGVADAVTSPTFSIVNEYLGKQGEPIYHFDFYRLKDEAEALDAGTADYLDSGDLCLLEWAERVAGLLPRAYAHINIRVLEDQSREITLRTYGPN